MNYLFKLKEKMLKSPQFSMPEINKEAGSIYFGYFSKRYNVKDRYALVQVHDSWEVFDGEGRVGLIAQSPAYKNNAPSITMLKDFLDQRIKERLGR